MIQEFLAVQHNVLPPRLVLPAQPEAIAANTSIAWPAGMCERSVSKPGESPFINLDLTTPRFHDAFRSETPGLLALLEHLAGLPTGLENTMVMGRNIGKLTINYGQPGTIVAPHRDVVARSLITRESASRVATVLGEGSFHVTPEPDLPDLGNIDAKTGGVHELFNTPGAHREHWAETIGDGIRITMGIQQDAIRIR